MLIYNLAKANVQFAKMYKCTNIMTELSIKDDVHHGTCYLFSFYYHKIRLFKKKYYIKLVTLISMYYLKTNCVLAGLVKIKMQMYTLLFVLTLFRSFS